MLSLNKIRKSIVDNLAKLDPFITKRSNLKKRISITNWTSRRVLVVGVYMADKKHFASHLAQEFSQSDHNEVTQAWVAIGRGAPDSELLKELTCKVILSKVPKYTLINEVLKDYRLEEYDYVIVTDDDVTVGKGFIDAFIYIQEKLDFSLAQPARTYLSIIAHRITKQRFGLLARETSFVEIGPILSVRKNVFLDIFPFDESSPMGWGYDFVWPAILRRKKLKMGIVDITPLNHTIRPSGVQYSGSESRKQMEMYLSNNKNISSKEAFLVHKSYKKLED